MIEILEDIVGKNQEDDTIGCCCRRRFGQMRWWVVLVLQVSVESIWEAHIYRWENEGGMKFRTPRCQTLVKSELGFHRSRCNQVIGPVCHVRSVQYGVLLR